MANNAEFWLIDSNWPLQNAKSRGGKLNPTILISPMNGVAMFHAS
jgi:hypothetical protein